TPPTTDVATKEGQGAMEMSTVQPTPGGYLQRPRPSGLADVIDVILDKGLVLDAFVRVSLVGIELLTVDARIVIASVDTYLRFAEAVNRLDLSKQQGKGLPEVIEGTQKGKAIGRAGDILGEIVERGTERARDRRER
ncbi:MAG TPA: gas vesicle protein GvpJ, partial [Micromonosporaceae bacterium]